MDQASPINPPGAVVTQTSPLSVDSINPDIHPIVATSSSLEQGTVKWVERTTLASYLDILALPRYVILPLFLLSSMGGPKYIFFIWPLVSLVTFLTYSFLFFLDKSLSTHLQLYKKYFPTQKITFHLLWVWSVIDLLFSVVSFVLAIVLATLVALDSDGTIVYGWRSLYISMIVECIFCAFSVICRIVIILGSCCIVFTNPPPAADLPIVQNPDDHHLDEEICQATESRELPPSAENSPFTMKVLSRFAPFVSLGLSLFFCFLSVIFVSLCLQDYMKSTYYLTDSTTDTNDKGCDPMIQHTCLLPYPSSFYLQSSTTTASGYQVAIPASALPFTKRGVQITAKYSANAYDGFAVGSMILWALDFGQHLDNTQLNSYEAIHLSTHLNSTTLLINTRTAELHSHFSEKDFIDFENNQMGYMMPSPSLLFNTTYVALVKGLSNKHNEYLRASTLTQQYLDAYTTSPDTIPSNLLGDPRYLRFQSTYFPLLQRMGINLTDPTDPIQIIWDFQTATHESLVNLLDLAQNKTTQVMQEKLANNQKLYEVVKEESGDSCDGEGKMSKVNYYKIKSPWYMKNHKVFLLPLVLSIVLIECQNREKRIQFRGRHLSQRMIMSSSLSILGCSFRYRRSLSLSPSLSLSLSLSLCLSTSDHRIDIVLHADPLFRHQRKGPCDSPC
jgi:hypothetical protein